MISEKSIEPVTGPAAHIIDSVDDNVGTAVIANTVSPEALPAEPSQSIWLTRMNELVATMGYQFNNPDLALQALTHKSFHFEHLVNSVGHNERFEFLGDAVLDLVLTAELMRLHPERPEGELSKIRASLVNETILAEIAAELNFQKAIRLGKGEKQSGGANKPRLLASFIEAFFGALFLDAGYDRARVIIENIFSRRLHDLDLTVHYKDDFKTRFQEKLQGESKTTPQYVLDSEEGPDHDKIFHVSVKVFERVVATGSGRSKKQAEQEAARHALEGSL